MIKIWIEGTGTIHGKTMDESLAKLDYLMNTKFNDSVRASLSRGVRRFRSRKNINKGEVDYSITRYMLKRRR